MDVNICAAAFSSLKLRDELRERKVGQGVCLLLRPTEICD